MTRRVLITGGTGFVGAHLPSVLAGKGTDILLLGHSADEPALRQDAVAYYRADLRGDGVCEAIIERFLPTHVVHLAGLSAVTVSHERAPEIWRSNFGVTQSLALALRRFDCCRMFVFASTGLVYGDSFLTLDSVDEHTAPQPNGTYARTKLAAEFALRDILPPDTKCAALRFFNTIGPGQDSLFVASDFAAQIAGIEAGLNLPVLKVGNLHPERDFIDVRDAVRGISAILDSAASLERFQTFNVASGTPRRISELVDILCTLTSVPFKIEQDESRRRVSEFPRIIGNSTRIRALTGWTPTFGLRETLKDTLDHWRHRLADNPRRAAS